MGLNVFVSILHTITMSICKALTKTGRQCYNKALKGACMCSVHQFQDHSPITHQDNIMFSLPCHVLEKITSYLSVKDRSMLAPVCRYFKRKQPTKQEKLRYIINRDIKMVQDSSLEIEFDNSIIYNLHQKKFVIYCKLNKVPSTEKPIMTFAKTYFYVYKNNFDEYKTKMSQDDFIDEFTNYMFPNREIMRLRDDSTCSVTVISSDKTSLKLMDLKYPHKLFKDSLDVCLISNVLYL